MGAGDGEVIVVRFTISESLLVIRQNGRTKCVEEGRCRMCGRPSSVRPLTRHHLVPQVWFKRRSFVLVRDGVGRVIARALIRDVDANIVPLCAPCHAEVEEDMGSRRMLRRVLAASEVAFAIKLRGEAWFARYYPSVQMRAARVAA
jgi:hypothetical protein